MRRRGCRARRDKKRCATGEEACEAYFPCTTRRTKSRGLRFFTKACYSEDGETKALSRARRRRGGRRAPAARVAGAGGRDRSDHAAQGRRRRAERRVAQRS